MGTTNKRAGKEKGLAEIIKRRPPIFWWILANLLAGAFAVASWTVCLYVFNFPERARNYELLRKLERLAPVQSFSPLEAPDGTSYDPESLLNKFWTLDDEQLLAHNRYFKRNYITNFKDPQILSYVEGPYRVLESRPLTPDDFFHPGVVVSAQALVQGEEVIEASPYPVFLEILLPTSDVQPGPLLEAGRVLDLKKLDHRALILHASKVGNVNEPAVCLSVVPIAYKNYLDAKDQALPLADPDPLQVEARFPVLSKFQRD